MYADGLGSTSRPGRFALHARLRDERGGHPGLQATPRLEGGTHSRIHLDRCGHPKPECVEHQGPQQFRPQSLYARLWFETDIAGLHPWHRLENQFAFRGALCRWHPLLREVGLRFRLQRDSPYGSAPWPARYPLRTKHHGRHHQHLYEVAPPIRRNYPRGFPRKLHATELQRVALSEVGREVRHRHFRQLQPDGRILHQSTHG